MTEDRRYKRTEKLIKDTFLRLLAEKNLTQITISEISRLADLGRGTFYLHYSDINDLYESIEKDLMEKLVNVYRSSFPTTEKKNSKKMIDEILAYIESEKRLFSLLVSSDDGRTMYKIRKVFYAEVFKEDSILHPDGDKEYDRNESVFVVSGVIGILEKWITEGFSVPSEKMSKMIQKMIVKING